MNTAQTPGEPPRLAFVSELGFGGATTFLCNLTGELVRRGVPVLVVSPKDGNAFASDFQAAGVKVVLQDGRLIFEDRLNAVMQTLAKFRPTAVVGCLGGESYEALRYVPPGIRRIAVIQTDYPMTYDAATPYAACLDDIVGISTRIAERLKKMDEFRHVAKQCLLHGVSIPKTFAPRGQFGRLLRILYLGRITDEQKRVYLFPKILEALKKSGIPFRWTIAGEGGQRASLERLMASSESGCEVLFPGPLPNTRVPALLENHDVFLLASEAEGLPISLLEAMAHGVVPVVSDLESGIRDVVDATNGRLVPVNDVEGYARAIIHLHEHREELAAKSAAARERVKKDFSVEAMTDRWLAAFPPTAAPISEWPKQWSITAPLTASHPIHFSPPVRTLRRMAARLRLK
jgi:glycosyltransferase involved in cell wall biosynthesis